MKWKFVLCILIELFFNSISYAKCSDKPIVIAVVDTGFGYKDAGNEAHLCKHGHRDFTYEQKFYHHPNSIDPVPLDTQGHGTNIVGIIETYTKLTRVNYCIMILKYNEGSWIGNNNMINTVNSFNYATNMGVDYINYSSGGQEPNESEKVAVLRFLDQGGRMVVAAGNDNLNLDLFQNGFYPAKYDRRLVVVGSLDYNGNKLLSSNFGSIVNRWELGLLVTAYGVTMSGTSQATAIATGKLVSKIPNKCEGK